MIDNSDHSAPVLLPLQQTLDLKIELPDSAWQPAAVTPVRTLGSGRAAQAILVKATGVDGEERLCVEKVFNPGLLTRSIYRCCFQAAFPYQTSHHAILACYHRRRVASKLIKALVPDVRIAEPLYVRWDDQASAFVLAAEFIEGRGIRPAAARPDRIRSKIFASAAEPQIQAVEEIDQLLDVMSRLETMLQQSGLVGSGWQVSKAAVVSTANLLKTETGYVVVDLESGIPAMLVAHYVLAGLKIRSLPLFDDVNPQGLEQFLTIHQQQLSASLGQHAFDELKADAEQLIEHSQAWKQSEVSVFRAGLPFFSSAFQTPYRKRCLDHWHRTGKTDSDTHHRFTNSKRLYSRLTYLAGLVPGPVGRFVQKLSGNKNFVARVRRLIFDSKHRKATTEKFCSRKSKQFESEGRVPAGRQFDSPGLSFQLNWILSKVAPAKVHRWLSDRECRKNGLMRIWLLLVSGRFQRTMGQLRMQSVVRSWQRDGRLQPGEYEQLTKRCASHELDEYSRCFGMHLSVKLASPLLAPLKIGGFAAFAASGNPAYLLPLLVSPLLRTIITLTQMIRNRRSGTAYGEALVVGMVPVLGTLAFPIQMYAADRALSTFLIRDAMARLSRMIPIYGGKDSRLEIFAIKAADLPLEIIDTSVNFTTKVRRLFSAASEDSSDTQNDPPITYRISRWDALAEQQLSRYREEEKLEMAADTAPPPSQSQPTKRAA